MPRAVPTQVFQCGGVLTYQLLCGREIARGDDFAESMANYCYLVVNTHDRTAIAIDAAWDVKGMYELADQLGIKVKGCIYTHFHFDHCGGEVHPMFTRGRKVVLQGAKEVQESGGLIWAGSGDAAEIKKQCGLSTVAELTDGDVIDCGDLVLHILRTPGHTPGSLCVFAAPQCLSPRAEIGRSALTEQLNKADGGLLITGDTLFVGSCGRVDLPGSNPREMSASLARLSTLPASVIVCPGHNYSPEPFTTIGAERANNDMMLMGLRDCPAPPPLPPCIACETGGPCGPRGFIIGRKVRIAGLKSEAGKELNGKEGVVEAFITDKERYAVRLIGASEVKVVKPENLDRAATSPAATL